MLDKADATAHDESARIKTVLKSWYETGVLKNVERKDEARHVRMYVEAGEFIDQ